MNLCHDIDYVLRKLDWMQRECIWPNGLRYLWTDAFGVVLLASLAGVTTVGLVDSLLDMPRVAWLMLWLAVLAVGLPAARGRAASAPA